MTYSFTTIITQEPPYFVARAVELGVVSQGKNPEEAEANLKEAVSLYIEDLPLHETRHEPPIIKRTEIEHA